MAYAYTHSNDRSVGPSPTETCTVRGPMIHLALHRDTIYFFIVDHNVVVAACNAVVFSF